MWSQSPLGRLPAFFAVVTLPAGLLAAMFIGLQAAAVVFLVGWLLLVPATAVLFGPQWLGAPGGATATSGSGAVDDLVREEVAQALAETGNEARSGTDPIDEIRRQYAEGKIDEAELERRLEALLETEDLDADDSDAVRRTVERLAERNDQPGDEPVRLAENDATSDHRTQG